MWKKLADGINARLPYRSWVDAYRTRLVPGGPGWVKTSASVLLWVFIVQLVTGVLLMASYAPSTTSAWASVHFIEQTWAGSLLRGIHYFAAQVMIVLFGLHMLRVLIIGGYRAPRELIWITGLILMPLVLAWAITGNPLSGSQKGFSQIDVEGHIIASTPIIGPTLRRVLIGGDQVGNLTLTHLYTLHVAILPLLVGVVLLVHVAQIFRYGLMTTSDVEAAGRSLPYWPFQTFRNMVALTIVLCGVTAAAWWLKAPRLVPADPELPELPRPEWYFLALFELRRYFSGSYEIIATLVIPLAVLGLLLVMPFVDRLLAPRGSRLLRAVILLSGISAWAVLTILPWWRDRNDPTFQRTARQVAALSARSWDLADRFGVPPEGAAELLKRDPKTAGPVLFRRNCAGCHPHADGKGNGIVVKQPTAPNLFGIGRVAWIRGWLDPQRITSPSYLGNTEKAEGDMVSKIQELYESAEDEAARKKLQNDLDDVAWALAAEAGTIAKANDEQVKQRIARGRALIAGEDLGCTDCHKFHEEGELGSAPDLTGYASTEWLFGMIRNPSHERFYPEDLNERMPAFAPHEFGWNKNQLSKRQLELLVAFLRGEWYEPATTR